MTPPRPHANSNVTKCRLGLIGLALAVVLAACSSQPAVTSVGIAGVPSSFNVGDTATLKAIVKPVAARQAVSWTSSDSGVVKVDGTGKITGVKVGTAKITATSVFDPTKSSSVTVTVGLAPAVTSVVIDQGDQTLTAGQTPADSANLTVTVSAVGGADGSVTWSSSDTSIATVSRTGPHAATITAVKPGTATVTATSNFDGTRSSSITVTVGLAPAVTSVVIDQGDQTLPPKGEDRTTGLTATVDAAGGADSSVTWTSSDTHVVKVASTGPQSATITAVSRGTATVTATSVFDPTKSATITVTVSKAPAVNSVVIDQGDQTLTAGQNPADSANLTATVDAVGGADSSVTWSSSDTGIAAVTQTGPQSATVTAVAAGSATITATSVFDPSKWASITVTVSMPMADPNNIYVDAAAAAGGDGSQSSPFRTITAGIGAVASGGTVHVAAGTYPESVAISTPLTLSGAGAGSTIIQVTDDVSTSVHLYATGGIDVADASNVTLENFSVQTQTGGALTYAISVYSTSSGTPVSGLNIDGVDITQNDLGSGGISLMRMAGATSTVQNTTVVATTASNTGAGISVSSSSNVTLSDVTTGGHDRYAGVLIRPAGSTTNNVSVSGTFGEINKMELDLRGGGTLTGLNAPQFSDVVRNSQTGSGELWFYKESQSAAILDALFNFGTIWQTSTIQPPSAADQAVLQNVYLAGSANGAPYGNGDDRANGIQAAIDDAAAGATINLVPGPSAFNVGPIDINKPNITIQGAKDGTYGITALSYATAPVLTVDSGGATVNGVAILSADTTHAGVLVNAVGAGFTINASNLLSSVALDDSAGVAVDASGNWWGDASGPSGDYSGSGNQLIDPSAAVVLGSIAGGPF